GFRHHCCSAGAGSGPEPSAGNHTAQYQPPYPKVPGEGYATAAARRCRCTNRNRRNKGVGCRYQIAIETVGAAACCGIFSAVSHVIRCRYRPSELPQATGDHVVRQSPGRRLNSCVGPRVSPDGRRVAFIVMIDAQTQVALMDAETGTWDVLTKRQEPGIRIHASWARDGSKIYFTRGSTEGVNIYSIPSVGGEERLVLDNAYFPEPLADGSLLVTRAKGTDQPQLYRFWPEGNRMEPLGVYLSSALDPLVPIRAFADGKEAAFFGRIMTSTGLDAEPHMYTIDLESKETRRVDSDLGVNAALWPVSVDSDRAVLSDSPAGDLHRVVS